MKLKTLKTPMCKCNFAHRRTGIKDKLENFLITVSFFISIIFFVIFCIKSYLVIRGMKDLDNIEDFLERRRQCVIKKFVIPNCTHQFESYARLEKVTFLVTPICELCFVVSD